MAEGAQEVSRRSRAAKSHSAVYPLNSAIGRKALCAALLALLAVAGCAQRGGGLVDEDDAGQRESAQRQALAGYQSWNLHARAVVRRPGESYHVGLQWKQDGKGLLMLLEAPFGQGVFRIDTIVGAGYRLVLPDGQVFENRSPEALLDEVFGWSMPISGMYYWIRGLPRPGSEYLDSLYDSGRTRSIRQDRWSIEYRDYFEDGPDPRLPRRMDLERDDIRIKLVIERWQLSEVEQQPSDLFPEFD